LVISAHGAPHRAKAIAIRPASARPPATPSWPDARIRRRVSADRTVICGHSATVICRYISRAWCHERAIADDPEVEMPRRLSWLSALPALVLAFALGPFVTPASAEENQVLEDYGVLTVLPAPTTPPQKCVQRNLDLDAGTYAWTLHTPGGTPPEKNIHVASDSYTWVLCVYPQDGAYNATTRLTPATPGRPQPTRTYVFQIDVTQNYSWSAEIHSV
jgi:hypothetical protein